MFCTFLLVTMAGAGYAQKVTFEADYYPVVALDENIKIEFTLNSSYDSFNFPVTDDFSVIAGPTTAHMRSASIINGRATSSVRYIVTYILRANAPGKFQIPGAEAMVKGTKYATRPISIEVVSNNSQGAAQQGSRQSPASRQDDPRSQVVTSVSSSDIILHASASKTSVYKGEPVRVTFKLYLNPKFEFSGFESYKLPAFNGFWSQEITGTRNTWERESLNSKIYKARIIGEYLLYPQQAGTLTIEQFTATAVAQIITSINRDPFGGFAQTENVRRELATPSIKINVKNLPPNAPVGFNGAVGSFNLTSENPTGEVVANSSSIFTLKVSGAGNLPLIQAPKLNLPSSFEQYNIKTTESLSSSPSGISGYRQFEYPFIPRAEGTYNLEPVVFTYFDPQQGKYVTLSSNMTELVVLPDSSGTAVAGPGLVTGLTKEELRLLGQDIHFIKLDSKSLKARRGTLLGSPLYFAMLTAIVGGFVFALIYLKKRIKEMKNSSLVRGKRANRVALQRLRAAEGHMRSGKERPFFDEMLKALWGYMSDKLNIPVANLTKENVREELLKRNVSGELAERYIGIISDCEYAQYSPAESGQMNEIYKTSVDVISKIESVIKK